MIESVSVQLVEDMRSFCLQKLRIPIEVRALPGSSMAGEGVERRERFVRLWGWTLRLALQFDRPSHGLKITAA